MPRDWVKANGLNLKAGELGHAPGYLALGKSYAHGSGVEVDKKKAKHYYELAVMNGSVQATYELAALEHRQAITNEHYERAKKLYTIAAKAGHEESLELVKKGFMTGVYTKDEYAYTLRAYQKRRDVMKMMRGTKLPKLLLLWLCKGRIFYNLLLKVEPGMSDSSLDQLPYYNKGIFILRIRHTNI